jgi:stage II sporulation protein R
VQVWESFAKKIIMQLKKDKKILLVSLSVGFVSCFIWGIFATQVYSETIQTGISQKVVRFHVRANSDTAEDQRLKLAVRDRILSEMGEELEACKNVEETKKLLQHSLERIEMVAQQEIVAQGYDNSVKAYLTTELFPKKQYGDLTFPSGMYTALRVDIGEAKGQNWWCVMFPPMCYVDAACQEVTEETKGRLAGTLTAEEYTVVASLDGKQGITPQVKFKVVELWQERKAKDTAKPAKSKETEGKKAVNSHKIKKHIKG